MTLLCVNNSKCVPVIVIHVVSTTNFITKQSHIYTNLTYNQE